MSRNIIFFGEEDNVLFNTIIRLVLYSDSDTETISYEDDKGNTITKPKLIPFHTVDLWGSVGFTFNGKDYSDAVVKSIKLVGKSLSIETVNIDSHVESNVEPLNILQTKVVTVISNFSEGKTVNVGGTNYKISYIEPVALGYGRTRDLMLRLGNEDYIEDYYGGW